MKKRRITYCLPALFEEEKEFRQELLLGLLGLAALSVGCTVCLWGYYIRYIIIADTTVLLQNFISFRWFD